MAYGYPRSTGYAVPPQGVEARGVEARGVEAGAGAGPGGAFHAGAPRRGRRRAPWTPPQVARNGITTRDGRTIPRRGNGSQVLETIRTPSAEGQCRPPGWAGGSPYRAECTVPLREHQTGSGWTRAPRRGESIASEQEHRAGKRAPPRARAPLSDWHGVPGSVRRSKNVASNGEHCSHRRTVLSGATESGERTGARALLSTQSCAHGRHGAYKGRALLSPSRTCTARPAPSHRHGSLRYRFPRPPPGPARSGPRSGPQGTRAR